VTFGQTHLLARNAGIFANGLVTASVHRRISLTVCKLLPEESELLRLLGSGSPKRLMQRVTRRGKVIGRSLGHGHGQLVLPLGAIREGIASRRLLGVETRSRWNFPLGWTSQRVILDTNILKEVAGPSGRLDRFKNNGFALPPNRDS
jgi:hypothetical protein